MKHIGALLLALAAMSCGGGAGTPTGMGTPPPGPVATAWRWRQLTPGPGPMPQPRSNGTAIYDAAMRRLVVFGGKGEQGLLNDVWAFDLATSTWTQLGTSGRAPLERLGANAVYDPNGHQMVLWAGQQGSLFFDDTWTLDLRTLAWREVSPMTRPQARYGSAAVFDPVERRLVQFAGFTSLFRRFQDVQAFDLDTLAWEDLTPGQGSPEVRCLLTAALHGPTRRMIAYGGQQAGPIGDVWSFDLATRQWTELRPASPPPGRMLAVSFMDGDGNFVVFSGVTAEGPVNETWVLNLARTEWSRLDAGPPPPARSAPQAAAVDGERFLVFGGENGPQLGDLWELARVPVGSLP